jgi:phosphomannomutase
MSIGNVFKAYDVRATYPDPLNEDVGWKVGYGVGEFLKQKNGGKPGLVVVSRDMRPSAPSMSDALIGGIRATGMDVIDLGMCDTSIQYFAVPFLHAAGGVQTTASHNPVHYIGFKISGPGARPIGKETGLADIEKIARSLSGTCPPPKGKLETRDLWTEYRKHVLSFLTPPKRKLKVFVDASNGMATTLLPKVFAAIPNVEVVHVNAEYVDKWAHEPNPLVAANVVPTQQGVKQHGADLGACFDGDADRCMLVDDQGAICGCDHLTALLAGHFLAKEPGSAIVYDLRSSKVVPETIAALSGKPAISKVGHVNIKALLRETDGIFGGELSGHFYFKHNNFADSGAITLAVALSVLGQSDQPLSKLIAPYRKYPQSGEQNFKAEDKAGIIAGLKSDFGRGGKITELDGVSIDQWDAAGKGWWFNVRASNTEPLLRLNAEARDAATLEALLADLTPRLGEPDHGH